MGEMKGHENHDFMDHHEMTEKIYDRMAQESRNSSSKEKKRFPNWEDTVKAIKNWIDEDEREVTDITSPPTLPHSYHIGDLVNCNGLTDEWWRWLISTPVANSPAYGLVQTTPFTPTLFKTSSGSNTARAYMVGISAFKKSPPDVKRIVLTEAIPTLIPVYNMAAGAEEFLFDEKSGKVNVPENQIGEKLTKIVLDDICGLRDFEATLDGHDISGCTVVRKVPYTVENIPNDNIMKVPEERLGNKNSMRVCHGGLYLELNPNSPKMAAGDHLLYIRAKSLFYEIEAQVHMSILTAITK